MIARAIWIGGEALLAFGSLALLILMARYVRSEWPWIVAAWRNAPSPVLPCRHGCPHHGRRHAIKRIAA